MTDVLVLSLGTTKGLRVADAGFAELLREAGASVALAATRIGATDRLRRGYPVNDVVEALAARRSLAGALARERPRAVVVSTTTAALLAPPLEPPFAIRFDAPAALNRPGRRNAPLHRLERRAMARARLLLPTSAVAAAAAPRGGAPAVVVPIPVHPSGPADGPRERTAVAYVPDPRAKGLDLLCAAWDAAAVEGAQLDVYGIAPDAARAFLARRGNAEPAGVRWQGLVEPERFRAALRGAHALVAAARWEDYGQAPLEALADGALLVTAPSAGPYEALPLARRLDPALVADDLDPAGLAACLRRAFAVAPADAARYRQAAAALLHDYSAEQATATLRERVLPALLG
jgi:hypothetical protein